jgi:multidrug efflux pump
MVVRANWPGATSLQMAEQVTDKLEKKLQETPDIDKIRSYSKPGETTIILKLRESTPPKEVAQSWYQVRKKIGDIRGTLPPGVQGPLLQRRVRRHLRLDLRAVRRRLHLCRDEGLRRLRAPAAAGVPLVSKVEQFGVQDEKINIEFSHKKFAQLGMPFEAIVNQIATQNGVESTGVLVTPTDNLQVRVTGALKTVKDLEDLELRANGTTFRLGDFATIKREYQDPPQDKMRFNGKEVIGLGVSMEKGGNIIQLGKSMEKTVAAIRPSCRSASSWSACRTSRRRSRLGQ